ncbi:MAG: energy transducer TonB [Chloroherpetonaceae bacterium]|nr:energy transducer TonB [Chloroherpetonaceae bacterium]MCS7210151.1 energy transducer TonB [Chloroherpetonaceae bacterium]MDW8020363.1 energy transducer TonB [Chloroherpetonaceae bacterium]
MSEILEKETKTAASNTEYSNGHHNDSGFIKLDYLDTERFRNINYGNLILRKESHKYLARGVFTSIGFVAGLLFTYIAWGIIHNLLKGDEEENVPVVVQKIDIANLQPPPPMDEKAPPPPPPAAIKPPQAPDIGEIKKVKDEEAPPKRTIADQNKLKEAIEKNAITGEDSTGFSEAVRLVAPAAPSGPAVAVDDNADPPDFVAVEKEPQFINQVKPVYPEIARKAGIEGRVVLRVLIDKDGKPQKAQILKNPGTDIFDEAAIASVMQSSYSPAIQNGKPVKCWLTVPIKFTLSSK